MRSPTRGNLFQGFILVWSISVQLILSYVMFAVLGIYDLMTVQIAFGFLLHLPLLLFYLIRNRKNPSEVYKIRWPGIKNCVYALLLLLFLSPLFTLISYSTSFLVENTIGESVIDLIGDNSLGTVLFAIAVMPAIFEELTYRGSLYYEYENMPIKKSALANGLFFGLMHLNMHQFFYAFVIGYILTFVVYHMKSIVPAILMHFFINAPQTALLYGLTLDDIYQDSMITTSLNDELAMLGIYTAITLLCLPLALSVYKKIKIHNQSMLPQKTYFTDNNEQIELELTQNQSSENQNTKFIRFSLFVPIVIYIAIMLFLFASATF